MSSANPYFFSASNRGLVLTLCKAIIKSTFPPSPCCLHFPAKVPSFLFLLEVTLSFMQTSSTMLCSQPNIAPQLQVACIFTQHFCKPLLVFANVHLHPHCPSARPRHQPPGLLRLPHNRCCFQPSLPHPASFAPLLQNFLKGKHTQNQNPWCQIVYTLLLW